MSLLRSILKTSPAHSNRHSSSPELSPQPPRPPLPPIQILHNLNANSLSVIVLDFSDHGVPTRKIHSYHAPQQQTLLAFHEVADVLCVELYERAGLRQVRAILIQQQPCAYIFTGKKMIRGKREQQVVDVYLAYMPGFKSWGMFRFMGELLPFVEWWAKDGRMGEVHLVEFPPKHNSVAAAAEESVGRADHFRILDLPRELRDQIIRFCLMEGTSVSVTCLDWPAWMRDMCGDVETPCR